MINVGIIFTNLALAIHVALPGLRDVHLSVLDFGNLYWVRKIQLIIRIFFFNGAEVRSYLISRDKIQN